MTEREEALIKKQWADFEDKRMEELETLYQVNSAQEVIEKNVPEGSKLTINMLKKDGTGVQLDTDGKQKVVDTGAGTILVVNNSEGNNVVINKNNDDDIADPIVFPKPEPVFEEEDVETVKVQERDAQVIDLKPGKRTVLQGIHFAETEVDMPSFISTQIRATDSSVSIHLSHDKIEGDFQGWMMMVVKLHVDEFNQPEFDTEFPMDYDIRSMARWGENQDAFELPYIAAEFAADDIPFEFTIGNTEDYNGYMNGKLDSDSYYAVFMAGVLLGKEGQIILAESDWVFDSHGTPAWFKTKSTANLLTEKATQYCVIAVGFVLLVLFVKLANRIRQRNHLSGKTGYSFTSASTRKNDTYNLFSDESDADDVIYNKPRISDSSMESVVGGFEKIGKAFDSYKRCKSAVDRATYHYNQQPKTGMVMTA